LGVRLREITIFLDWLQEAVNALNADRALPAIPALQPGEALEWVQTLQKREERMRHGEETILALRRELSAKGEHLLRLAHDLESAQGQVKALQAVCEELKLDADRHRATTGRLLEVEQERDRLVLWIKDWIKNTTGYLVKSVSEWERVSGENKELPNAQLRK
jgi:ribonuclease D